MNFQKKTKKNNNINNNDNETNAFRKYKEESILWSDRVFKIFDVKLNGNLNLEEFRQGCQLINLNCDAIFNEIISKREQEKKSSFPIV